jgi:hypothetical protein
MLLVQSIPPLKKGGPGGILGLNKTEPIHDSRDDYPPYKIDGPHKFRYLNPTR